MKPITTVTGPAAALPRANIDTDQIIPARFMSRSRAEGYGEQCFRDLRFADDGSLRGDFPLNILPAGPTVLVAGNNFGCGSSREAAVYALLDYGVQVVVAPGFADIFRSNAGKNGLLTVALPAETIQAMTAALQMAPGQAAEVDLPSQLLRAGGIEARFDIDPRLKYRLVRGLDELSATLEYEAAIAAFEQAHLAPPSWRVPLPRHANEDQQVSSSAPTCSA